MEAVKQRKLCYRVRFGTQGRKSWEQGVSVHASQHEAVETQVMQIKDGAWQGYQNPIFKRLFQGGFIYEFLPEYYLDKGILKEALETCNRELSDMKETYDETHDLTIDAKNNVEGILKMQGKWEAAEALDVEVMETRKARLGPNHPSILISIANLALTYWKQGRWEAAEALGVEMMETRKARLRANHPNTLTSMNNLTFTWKG